jgi:hypothetical protein
VALANLVADLAADVQVLIAIDDLQWLDARTTTALAFHARRLPARNVGIVVTMRTPGVESRLAAELEAEWALRRIDVPTELKIVDMVSDARLGPGQSAPLLAGVPNQPNGGPHEQHSRK